MPANIKPLKMCINITIPSVEDTDLSLYEAMCTLASKLQDTINEINDILADVVVSVNGHQGPEVLLTGDDIPTSATISSPISTELNEKYSEHNQPPYPVTSVNGKQGNVVISGDDISINADDDQSMSEVLSQKYGADNPPPYPVTSVNGKQDNVVISGDDISVSSTDDQSISGVLGQKYSADSPPPYPVTSVAGKTGQVTLTGNDITLIGGDTVADTINDIRVELRRKIEFTSVASTSWDSVKDNSCGIYRTTGFVPWSSSLQDNGLLVILGSYTSIVAYIFIRESVPDNVYFAIGSNPSASDWYFIAGNPLAG